MAGHSQQHLIELDGNKPAGVLLAVSNIVQSSQVHVGASLCPTLPDEVICF